MKVVWTEREVWPLMKLMLVELDTLGPERVLKPLNEGPLKLRAWSLTTKRTVKLLPE